MRGIGIERTGYAAATVVVVGVGLSTRRLRPAYPVAMDAAGDALWAATVFLAVSVVVPRVSVWTRAGAAVAFSYAVEFAQLYRAPWIGRVRATTLGHLVLGSDFDPWDLVKYAVGVGVAAGLVRFIWPGRAPIHTRGPEACD